VLLFYILYLIAVYTQYFAKYDVVFDVTANRGFVVIFLGLYRNLSSFLMFFDG